MQTHIMGKGNDKKDVVFLQNDDIRQHEQSSLRLWSHLHAAV